MNEKRNWWLQPYNSSSKKDKILTWLIALSCGGILPMAIIFCIMYFVRGIK